MRARLLAVSVLACSTPVLALFGCTAILGDFELGAASAVAPEASAPSSDVEASSIDANTEVDASARGFAAKLVTAGERHTCALDTSGAVYCWGDNGDGQLGLSADVPRSTKPVKVPLPSDVTKLVSGAFHTCAVTANYTAYCWGRNACGQIGAGDTVSPSPTPRSVAAVGVEAKLQWTEIAPGKDHTCALEAGGQTYCWGCNANRAAGEIPAGPVPRPTNAGSDKGRSRAIDARSARTCLLGPGGEVRCWGTELHGEFGNGGAPREESASAVDARLTSSVAAFSVGESHTCALTTDRELLCWGDNAFGQLAVDSVEDVTVPGMNVWAERMSVVAAGGAFTCAIAATDRIVSCVGKNQQGELGRGGAVDTARHSAPESVVLPGNAGGQLKASAISAGLDHACAVTLDTSEVVCWGNGTDGQLGDGTAGGPPRTTPVFVQLP